MSTGAGRKERGLRKFFRDNGLSITLVSLFVIFWAAQAITGFYESNHAAKLHGKPPLKLGEYLAGEDFWEATFENWESEFLQMAAYVVLTAFLFQRGSAESKDPDKSASGAPAVKHSWLVAHSLSLALFGLF